MLFNSIQYVIFLPCIIALYFLLPQKVRWLMLLIASYYFYMSWNANLIVLISSTTLVAYISALQIYKTKSEKQKKIWLIIACVFSLTVLFFFKYFNFFSLSATTFLRSISLPIDDFTLNVMLPVGISFYTFQTLSYVVDVYKGLLKPERHLGIFALYVSFFPQLVAGPIERAINLLPQFHEKHSISAANFTWGLRMICLGLTKKMFVADFVAQYANMVFNDVYNYSPMAIAIACLFFAVQIYCDFSGYSDIARGSAKILGFNLMINFNTPYFSKSIREFWSRWHISLSSFLKDYVYIPLGGSRKGKRRTIINLIITFLLSGLWHGAAWTFVLWGLLHGIGQAVGNLTQPARQKIKTKLNVNQSSKIYAGFQILFVFTFVCVSWVLFRANTLSQAFYILTQLPKIVISPISNFIGATIVMQLGAWELLHIAIGFAVLFAYDFVNYKFKCEPFELLTKQKSVVRHIVSYIPAVLAVYSFLTIPSGVVAEFIYFQF